MHEAYETMKKKFKTFTDFLFCVIVAGNLENECLTVMDSISRWLLIHVYPSTFLAGIREFNDTVKSPKWLIHKSLSMTADG